MDRQMDIESRHVICVTLALSSAHACTPGNVNGDSQILELRCLSCFFFIECHMGGGFIAYLSFFS